MERITVQRANVVLDISPEEKQYYMDQGYSVIDSKTGKVIEAALSNDVGALRVQVTELMKANKALKAENEELLKEVQELQATVQPKQKKTKKSEE